jgi:hypothetical protein
MTDLDDYLWEMVDIPGWLSPLDTCAMVASSEVQGDGAEGAVLEIGAFLGRSTIALGYVTPPDELIVCDPFDDGAGDQQVEHERWYQGLTRQRFEENFLRFHPSLPVIHPCRSDELDFDALPPLRLAHVDGGHSYDVVSFDLRHVLPLLVDGGVVVIDDWCVPHTPGVAAAVWAEVGAGNLHPFAVTNQKMYATASGHDASLPDRWLDLVTKRYTDYGGTFGVHHHEVAGHELLELERVVLAKVTPPSWHRWVPPAFLDAARRARALAQRGGES